MARKSSIQGLYYITHINNIPSILEKGILSHELIEAENIPYQTIYNLQVVSHRSHKIVPGTPQSLWHFANLYFQPKNAILYAVINGYPLQEVAIIGIKKTILNRSDIWITTGNAAHSNSQIFPISQGKAILDQIRDQIDQEWWNNEDGSKRKMMAECLVPEKVDPGYISIIYVPCDQAKARIDTILNQSKSSRKIDNIVVEPYRFFQPNWSQRLTQNISLIRGDMFFSKMQTLTVSVNCVGVMGKGLASTAKNRFPDVYVQYQKACQQKLLQIGIPYLYKRESSVLEQLADDSLIPNGGASSTWFLLFPTKNHWRNDSNLGEIEKGLQWLVENYQREGIQSLAIPALGCGLGKLQWREVGPLMCQYLRQMEIQSAVYLPAETKVEKELLSAEFLLSD